MERDPAYLLDMLNMARRAEQFVAGLSIIGMRNRLIHEYFPIDLAIVWDVLQNHLPVLIEQLEPLVPPEQP